jgi:hypothetical protein
MPIDITKVFEKYKGQWVAFKDDEKTVVGNGKTAKEACEKAITNGYNKPILARIPVELVNNIGYSL